jgi:predicted RNase H-like HicB family nuclease
MNLTAIFMKVPEGYVGFVEELAGANTQGSTLDEARSNLREAVALVLNANRAMSEQSLEGAAVIRETFVHPRHEAGRSDPPPGTLRVRVSARRR